MYRIPLHGSDPSRADQDVLDAITAWSRDARVLVLSSSGDVVAERTLADATVVEKGATQLHREIVAAAATAAFTQAVDSAAALPYPPPEGDDAVYLTRDGGDVYRYTAGGWTRLGSIYGTGTASVPTGLADLYEEYTGEPLPDAAPAWSAVPTQVYQLDTGLQTFDLTAHATLAESYAKTGGSEHAGVSPSGTLTVDTTAASEGGAAVVVRATNAAGYRDVVVRLQFSA